MRKNTMEKLIHLRPHHLLCLQAFRGKGYSADFVKKMTEVHGMLRDNPACRIVLTEGADDLCAACPNLEEGVCTSPKPPVFDKNVLRKLLENGSAPESVTGIPASLALTGDLVRSCCPDCQWQEICLEVCNS